MRQKKNIKIKDYRTTMNIIGNGMGRKTVEKFKQNFKF